MRPIQLSFLLFTVPCADKSLARPGRKGSMSGASEISTTSRRGRSSNLFSCKTIRRRKFHAILTETLACFLPGRAKDLSAPLYVGYSCPCLYVILLHFSHDRSNWSSPSFYSITFRILQGLLISFVKCPSSVSVQCCALIWYWTALQLTCH